MANRRKANLQPRNIDHGPDCFEFNPTDDVESSTTVNVAMEEKLPCTVCPEICNSINAFKKHIRIHSGENLYDCELCDTSWTTNDALNDHMLVHTDGRKPRCEICDSEFDSESNLTNHMLTHSDKKYYTCSVCNQSFIAKWSLINHQNYAHKINEFETTATVKNHSEMRDKQEDDSQTVIQPDFDCSKSPEAVLMKRQMLVHTAQPNHKNEISASALVFKRKLTIRMVPPTRKKRYILVFCKGSAATKPSLKSHQNITHQNDEFATMVSMKTHNQTEDYSPVVIHSDSDCLERPDTVSIAGTVCPEALVSNQLTKGNHQNDADQLGKPATTPNIENHLEMLEKIEDDSQTVIELDCPKSPDTVSIPCTVCPKALVNSHEFEKHIQRNGSKILYNCLFCHQSHTSRRNLKRHMLVHTGERSHKCEICGFAFKLKHNLRDHILTHIGERRHTCLICNKSYTRKSILKTHVNTVHKKQITRKPSRPIQPKRIKIINPSYSTRSNNQGSISGTCNICPDKFFKSHDFDKHIRIHGGKTFYKCLLCNRSLARREYLKGHIMLVHFGEKKYKCDICYSKFKYTRTLMRHMLIHTGESQT